MQSGTVLKHSFPHSYEVQLDDGRIWRRHVDDILQSNPATKLAEPLTSSPDEVLQPSSVEEVSHSPITVTPESNVPVEEDTTRIESTPIAPVTPEPRRSTRVSKPSQRLIEQI